LPRRHRRVEPGTLSTEGLDEEESEGYYSDAYDGSSDIFEKLYNEGMEYLGRRQQRGEQKKPITEQHANDETFERLYNDSRVKKQHQDKLETRETPAKKKSDKEVFGRLLKPRVKHQSEPENSTPTNKPRMKGMSSRLQSLYTDHRTRNMRLEINRIEADQREQDSMMMYQKGLDGRRADPAVFERLHNESASRKKKLEEVEICRQKKEAEAPIFKPTGKANPETFSRLYNDSQNRETLRQFKMSLLKMSEEKSIASSSVHRNVTHSSGVFDRLYKKPLPEATDPSFKSFTDSFEYLPQGKGMKFDGAHNTRGW